MNKSFLAGAAALTLTLAFSASAQASTLWIGNDTQSPVERWSTTGAFLGAFGAGGATGTALDGAYAWTVQPGGGNSVITKYDASQTALATINFTSGIDNGRGYPSWIEDMASGASHSLWLSGYNGNIYNIDTSGNVLSNFSTGHSYSGIEVVGNSIYTTHGFDDGSISHYDLSGNLLGTITTGFTQFGGLAYDPTDKTFWAGQFNQVVHLSLTGATLGTLAVGNEFHDGLAIGDLATAGIPEPTTWALMIGGFGMMGAALRRRRTAVAVEV